MEITWNSLYSDVLGVATVKGLLVHVAARQSPYPGTSVTRFPVFDKYVPWEVSGCQTITISRNQCNQIPCL
jgi:hypothetical protein